MASVPAPAVPPDRPERPPAPVVAFGGRPPRGGRGPGLSNRWIAVVMLLVGESMLFTGFIGSFLLLRVGSLAWPPPGLPHLPIAVTWLNTAVLAASALAMRLAVRAARAGEPERLARALGVAGFLGVLFLAIQGSEWARLVRFGLTLSSGTYGATFYLLIGTHGVHVVAAVVWLLAVHARARRGAYRGKADEGVRLCALYWYYVCGVWAVLFPLVYLL